jgi:16S rRNA processing protein RimM
LAIKIKGIDSHEAAEEWRNSDLLVAEENLEPLDENEYYLHDLEGMTVLTAEGQLVGRVVRIDTQTANAILNVKRESGDIILIPFVKAHIKEINKKGNKIIIDYIEGLY